jgi:hypothetical protein
VSFDEWVTVLHHTFTRLGRDDWIDWPLDRVLLFWHEELERKAERHEALARHLSQCGKKVAPRVMFVLPVD